MYSNTDWTWLDCSQIHAIKDAEQALSLVLVTACHPADLLIVTDLTLHAIKPVRILSRNCGIHQMPV